MPVYYNLTLYDTAGGLISMMGVTDNIIKGFFSLFIIAMLGIMIFAARKKAGDDTLNAIILGSFWSTLMAVILYASHIMYSGIIKPGLYIFIPALIWVISISITWYRNRVR